MKAKTLRHAIIGLLIFTGVFHLAVALLNVAPGLGLPIAGFGVVYTGLSFYVRRDIHKGAKFKGRAAMILTVLAALAGLALGATAYLQNSSFAALPILLAIDVLIAAAGVLWLAKAHKKA